MYHLWVRWSTEPWSGYFYRRYQRDADYFALRREIIYGGTTVIVRTPSSDPETTPLDETDGFGAIDGEF